MKTPSQTLAEAIALIRRPHLRGLTKQLLRERGYEILASGDTIEGVSDTLVRNPEALLVIDFDLGLDQVNMALGLAMNRDSAFNRPTLLMAQQITESLLAVASDYQVTRLATGDVTLKSLGEDLDKISLEITADSGVSRQILEVSKLRKKGDNTGAGALLSELQGRFPSHTRINCDLIDHLLTEEKWDEASAVIDTVKVSYGSSTRLMQLHARILMHQGEVSEAIALLEQCNLTNPYYVERLVDLGNALLTHRKNAEALSYFNQALHLDSTHEGAKKGKVTCHLLKDDLNEALQLLRESASPRERASLFNTAAVLAIRSDRFEHSLKLYETAISVLGKSDKIVAKLIFNLGLAYLKNERVRHAIGCFKLAVKIDPSFKKVKNYLHLVNKNQLDAKEDVTLL